MVFQTGPDRRLKVSCQAVPGSSLKVLSDFCF